MPGVTQMLVQVNDPLGWGHLVKSWALETATRPGSLAELQQQAGTMITVPDFIADIEVIQRNREVLVIHLPSKSLLEAAEQALQQSGEYPLPHFYGPFFPGGTFHVSPLKREAFQAMRIGEYSIAQCL